MFYQIYIQIKDALKGIEELSSIQWFNAQYEGTIYSTPVLFVEFPERMNIAEAYKSGSRAPLMVRLHLVTTAVTTQDGVVSDQTVIEHESLTETIRKALYGLPVEFNNNPARPLTLSGWQHYQKWKGWMVTFIEFSTKVSI